MRLTAIVLAFFVMAPAVSAWERDAESARNWRDDLAYFKRELPRRHINAFHDLTPAQFDSMIGDIDAHVTSMQDYEIIVGLARIIAHLGPHDGHSRINLFSPALKFHALPLNFYSYSDGVFIRAASEDHADLVGARVVAIGKTPIDRAFEVVQGMTPADNAMSKKSFGAEIMSLSEVLRARGVVSGNPEDAIPMTLEFPDRSRRDVSVAPVDASQHVQWRDLRATPVLYRKFASADPMNRHGAQKNFWYEYIADRKVLYVNYSAVADMPDESVAAFFKRVYEFADKNPVDKFVIDIRNNSGGNNYLNRPIFYGLMKRIDTIGKRGTLFAIIGRETFSAAQNLANMLDMHTDAILVGEPTGGSPNHFGDPLPMTLPNSKLEIRLSSVWWQDFDPRDFRPWIPPTIAAEPSSADDREGRDPALNAIFAYAPEKSLTETLRDALAKDRSEAARAYATWKSDPRHKFLTGESELNRLGANLFGEKRADDAVAIFELNAAVNPDSWLAQNSLGRAYNAMKRTDEARAAFERALRIRPNAPQTLSAMDPR